MYVKMYECFSGKEERKTKRCTEKENNAFASVRACFKTDGMVFWGGGESCSMNRRYGTVVRLLRVAHFFFTKRV